MIWRVEVRDPAGEGEWELWGRHPSEAEAQAQQADYVQRHPTGEARVVVEQEIQAAQTLGAKIKP
jgi:hypothetical protein